MKHKYIIPKSNESQVQHTINKSRKKLPSNMQWNTTYPKFSPYNKKSAIIDGGKSKFVNIFIPFLPFSKFCFFFSTLFKKLCSFLSALFSLNKVNIFIPFLKQCFCVLWVIIFKILIFGYEKKVIEICEWRSEKDRAG